MRAKNKAEKRVKQRIGFVLSSSVKDWRQETKARRCETRRDQNSSIKQLWKSIPIRLSLNGMKCPRLRTLTLSLPVPLTIMLLLGLAAAYRPISIGSAVANQGAWSMNSAFVCVGLIGFFLIAIQWWANYKAKQYDPTWALKIQDLLNDTKTSTIRGRGAKHYQDVKEWDRDVEASLDILEDLGFYVENQVIGVEVAHHHFYHWIRGYVQTADGYIKNYQKDQPLAYEFCVTLLATVSEYEAKKSKKHVNELVWGKKEIDEFIQGEIEECKEESSSS